MRKFFQIAGIGGLIFVFFLSGCSDPSHPTAKNVLREIEQKVAAQGQVNLSDLSKQFDEICIFSQDDSDTGYTLMHMKTFLSKKSILLLSEGDDMPDNPQNIVLLIKGQTAVAAYDWEFDLPRTYRFLLFEGYEEKYNTCRAWNKSVIVYNGKLELR
jgi:hypothetical protein